MKRLLAVLLTSCMIIGLASPAGSGLRTRITANAEAGATNVTAGDDTAVITEIADGTSVRSSSQTASAAENAESLTAKGDGSSGKADSFGEDGSFGEADISGQESESGSFDESISALYDSSMNISNEEILSAAELMPSDFSKVEQTVTTGADDLIDAVKSYVAAKGLYMTDRTESEADAAAEEASAEDSGAGSTEQSADEAVSGAADSVAFNIVSAGNAAKAAASVNTGRSETDQDYIVPGEEARSGIEEEWKKQAEYTSYVVSENSVLEEVVPRVKITSCEISGADGSRTALLGVYEWTTVGYRAPDSDSVDAAAYGYEYSVRMAEEGEGWQVAGIEDTEQNFDWMEDEESSDAGDGNLTASGDTSSLVSSEDGTKDIMAASNVNKSYTYNRAAAIAYGDRYCKSYNSSYRSYKGRGGDCANFVSQCLFAGGMPTDSVWYKNSTAWINVMAQISHFKNYGTFMTASNSNILAGNPVWFDWKNDGRNIYNHATICVGRNSAGTAIIDSHTSDLYHSTWNHWSFYRAATIQLRDSATVTATASAKASVAASSGGSWKSNGTGTWYQYANGSYPKGTFWSLGGKTYYFDDRGYLVKGWRKVGGKWYFMNTSTGEMMTGWIKVNGKLYYLQNNGAAYISSWQTINGKKYYFDSSAAAATGFATVGGKKYYFDGSGVMQTGWVTVGSKKYYLGTDGIVRTGWKTISSRRYFFNASGEMQTGKVSIDGQGYDFGSDGALTALISAGSCSVRLTSASVRGSGSTVSDDSGAGWVRVGNGWMYFQDGKTKTGWQKIGGRWYYMDSSGSMKTGWQKIGGSWYYMNSGGAMLTGWIKVSGSWYYLGSGGAMKTGWQKISGNWYYLGPGGAMKTGWQKISGYWYYLSSGGVMKTGWVKVNGKWYYLGSGGAMKTGWQKIGGRKYYLQSGGAMATGLTTIGGGKYYFNSNGTIRTGWVTVKGRKYFFSPSRGGRCATGYWDINGKVYHFSSDGVLQ